MGHLRTARRGLTATTPYTLKTLEGDTRPPAVTPEPAPEPTAAELGARIDAAIERLLWIRIGNKGLTKGAAEACHTEIIKCLIGASASPIVRPGTPAGDDQAEDTECSPAYSAPSPWSGDRT